jgi:hypothetical protein
MKGHVSATVEEEGCGGKIKLGPVFRGRQKEILDLFDGRDSNLS